MPWNGLAQCYPQATAASYFIDTIPYVAFLVNNDSISLFHILCKEFSEYMVRFKSRDLKIQDSFSYGEVTSGTLFLSGRIAACIHRLV